MLARLLAVAIVAHPEDHSAHTAKCKGVAETMTIVEGIAPARRNQGGSDGQR
jgi:hypothetical protein